MSVHFVKNGLSRLVVCSDSRGTSAAFPPRDDVIKLFQVGPRMLCAILGKSGTAPGDPIGGRILQLAENDGLRDSPRVFLEALRDELHPCFVRMLADDPERFTLGLEDSILFMALCVTRTRRGAVDLFELRIPMSEVGGKEAIGHPEIAAVIRSEARPFAYTIGQVASGSDRLLLINPEDPDEMLLAAVDRTVENFKAGDAVFSAEVGGSIDVAVIDAEGFRWLRRDISKALNSWRSLSGPRIGLLSRVSCLLSWVLPSLPGLRNAARALSRRTRG